MKNSLTVGSFLFLVSFQSIKRTIRTYYEQQNLIFYVTSITERQKSHLLINTPSIFC